MGSREYGNVDQLIKDLELVLVSEPKGLELEDLAVSFRRKTGSDLNYRLRRGGGRSLVELLQTRRDIFLLQNVGDDKFIVHFQNKKKFSLIQQHHRLGKNPEKCEEETSLEAPAVTRFWIVKTNFWEELSNDQKVLHQKVMTLLEDHRCGLDTKRLDALYAAKFGGTRLPRMGFANIVDTLHELGFKIVQKENRRDFLVYVGARLPDKEGAQWSLSKAKVTSLQDQKWKYLKEKFSVGESHVIKVVNVKHPRSFIFHFIDEGYAETQEVLNGLDEHMESYSRSLETVSDVILGEKCAVKDCGMWWRAVIQRHVGDDYELLLVDRGDVVIRDYHGMYYLDQEFQERQPLANLGQLEGVKPPRGNETWTDTQIDAFCLWTYGQYLEAKIKSIVDENDDFIFCLELTWSSVLNGEGNSKGSEDRNVKKDLVALGLAAEVLG